MTGSDTNRQIITYRFRGKERTANVAIVRTASEGEVYWLRFPKKPPCYFRKESGGAWSIHGIKDLPEGLMEALTAAIDEQVITNSK